MALKITANADHVVQLAADCGRLDQFGYKGWRMLAEAMDQLSDDIGEDIEVDVITWCCEYTHAASVEEAYADLQHYDGWSVEPDEWDELDDDERLEVIREFLQDNSTVVVCEHDCIIWPYF